MRGAKGIYRLRLAGLALLLAVVLAAAPARALDWSTLAQPVGTFVGNAGYPSGVYDAAVINTILGGNPPFDSGTGVTLIRVTQTHQYVRFYNPTALVNPSGAVGSWMMRASEVRGLTAVQIRNKFALLALPTNIVQVLVPVNYALYTGIAAPIAGWGDGGGLQNRVMANKPPAGIAADPWLPGSSYANAQALGSGGVLSYSAAAGSGAASAGRMAAYMDALTPRANSDLDGVYNSLDTLLFTGHQAGLAQALEQFSPARFSAMNTVSLRAGALYAASLDARSAALAAGGGEISSASSADFFQLMLDGGAGGLAAAMPQLGRSGGAELGQWSLWLRGTGEYLRENAKSQTAYSAVTGALHAGADRNVAPGLALGLGASLARTRLTWEQDGGDADTNTFGLSAYGFWTGGAWFANADLGLEAAFTDARRRIKTAVTDRTASSSQSGQGGSLRLRAGKRLEFDEGGWTLVPSVELGYALHRQNAFRESGAGDLNLDLRAATAQTLRTGAELAFVTRVDLADGAVLTPEAALGWLRETPLDNRMQRAAFSGYTETFQTYADDSPQDSLLLRAGLVLAGSDGQTRYARYSGTLRDRFQAHSVELGCRWSF